MPLLRTAAVALLGMSVAAGCVAPGLPTSQSVAMPATIKVRTGNRIVSVPIEEYVLGSALSEVSPLREAPPAVARIFEVQAILARTYAAAHLGRHRAEGFDVCDTTHCQLYEPARIRTSRFANAAREAVDDTRGLVLAFSQRPAEALYHSDCGGHTAAADVVWGGAPVPYLKGTRDDLPPSIHRNWEFDVAADRLRAALNLDRRSDVGRQLRSVAVVKRDDSGRAASIELQGDTTRAIAGEEARAILNRTFGDRAIQSTRLSVTKAGSSYHFVGTGFGHGVGLCQVGAAARASRGESVATILGTYFPRTVLAHAALNRAKNGNPLGRKPPELLESP